MALPPNPDAIASYWGVDPTQVPANDDAKVNSYWSGAPVDAAAPTGYAPSSLEAGLAAANGGQAPPVKPDAPAVPAPAPMGGALGIDSSWLGGASAPALPPVGATQPGDLFGTKAPPAIPPATAPAQPKPVIPDRPLVSAKEQAADDAAFRSFVAKMAPPSAAPAGPRPVGGVAKAANPDPYGIEAARKAQLASFDDRKGALDRAATAQQDATVMQAEHMGNLARMQEEDAAIGRAENEIAQRHFDDSMTEINRQLDDVKSRKVDPLRMMKESPALGALAVVGGIVGGFYQGLTGKDKNPFLEDLNRQIDRDVAEQERQIKDERSAVGEKASLLQQLRASQKDKTTADLQYRNLAYEAAKGQISAEAQAAGTGVARANADDAIAQLSAAQAQLQEQIAARKQAAAAAAAAQSTSRAKEIQAALLKQYDDHLKEGYSPRQAMDVAQAVVGRAYLPGMHQPIPDVSVGGDGMTREQRGKVAMDKHEAQRVSDAFNKEIDEMKRHPALNNLGLWTAAAAKLGQRIAPESAATEQDLNEINTSIINAIGKTAKDAEGKPNVAMMQMYEHRFSINPTDTKEIALRKLDGAREVVNRLAAQQGAATPEGKTSVEAKLGAKPVR